MITSITNANEDISEDKTRENGNRWFDKLRQTGSETKGELGILSRPRAEQQGKIL